MAGPYRGADKVEVPASVPAKCGMEEHELVARRNEGSGRLPFAEAIDNQTCSRIRAA